MPFGLGGSVSEAVGDVVGRPNDTGSAGEPFPRKFNADDFDGAEFGGTMQAGQFNRVGTYTVPAGTEVSWGSGKASNEANQGYMYVFLKDADGNEVVGTLRIAQTTPTERETVVVGDYDSDELHGSKSNREQKQPLPEQVDKPIVEKQSKLIVEFKPSGSSSVTIDSTETDFSVPWTEYDL